ncbi:MAG: Nit6803 family nitrilase [Bacteroidota bacterium]
MASKTIIKAAAAQLKPVLNNALATTEKICDMICSSGLKGANIIVFPETCVPSYPYFSFVLPPALQGAEHLKLYDQAVVVPGPLTDMVATAARDAGMVVVLGVNERDHGSLYNTQLIFDTTGELVLKRRKITPTYHERMIWGQGDGSGLKAVQTSIARIGALACWEHYNPLARYALMADHEEIHCGQFPGSLVGQIFADQMEVTMRHHALESGCFVINATGWLDQDQITSITSDQKLQTALRGGCNTMIISPEGRHLCEPMTEGEGIIYAEMDMRLIDKRKRMMDSVGHYSRPELLSLNLDATAHQHALVKGQDSLLTDKPLEL